MTNWNLIYWRIRFISHAIRIKFLRQWMINSSKWLTIFVSYLLLQHFDINMHGTTLVPSHGVVIYDGKFFLPLSYCMYHCTNASRIITNWTYAYLPVFCGDLCLIIYLVRGFRKRVFPNNGYNNFNDYAGQWRVKISETRNRAVKTKHWFFVNTMEKIQQLYVSNI